MTPRTVQGIKNIGQLLRWRYARIGPRIYQDVLKAQAKAVTP